jgi:bile acid:Na+ symporter, BASS family
MQGNLLTEIFLPLSLSIIMLGMGLALTIEDFKRITIYPKAVITGLIAQLILLPIIAFGLMIYWDIKPEFAVGIILLAACPGGATSNLFAYLAKCDAALSITLTAITSFITIFTIPLIVNYGMELFMGSGQYVALPVLKTMIQIMIITVIPVSIGMFIKLRKPDLALKFERPVKIASAIFIAIIILGAIFKDRENVIPFFKATGLPALLLNVITLIAGFLTGKLAGLNFRQSATISIEAGIQNGTLAIAIAASATLLNNPQIAVPPAIYSLIMFATGALVAWFFGRRNGKVVA